LLSSILYPIRDYAQCQCFGPSLCLFLSGTVGKYTGEFRDVGNPTPVFLSIKFDEKFHMIKCEGILQVSRQSRNFA
jgi:hypothetical protein